MTRTSTRYTLEAVENLMQRYIEAVGKYLTVQEGILGYGITICFGEGLKTAVITETYVNYWTSTHKIRMYNKMPEKYQQMIGEYYNKLYEDDAEN